MIARPLSPFIDQMITDWREEVVRHWINFLSLKPAIMGRTATLSDAA